MPRINTDTLSFTDLSSEKLGSFVDTENLKSFMDSDIGKAQIKSLEQEIGQQMADQGIGDYEVTEQQLKRALFSEQSHQDEGYREPDMTNEEMLEEYSGGFFAGIGQAFHAAASGAASLVGLGAEAGADLAADAVTKNSGGSGKVAKALEDRQGELDSKIDQALGGPSGP